MTSELKVDIIKNADGSNRTSFQARGYAGGVNLASTHNGLTAWYFDTVDHNVGSAFSNSSSTGGVFTVAVAGTYLIQGGYGYKNSTDHLGLMLWKNTTNVYRSWTVNTSPQHHNSQFSHIWQCSVGDEFRIGNHSSYGVPHTDTYYAYFNAHLLV